MTENTNTKKTFAERAATEPTELHKRFADWLKAQTGVDVDLKTVQLVTTMRMDFQRSEDNQTALADRKAQAAKAEADRVAKRKAKLEAELAKLKGAVAEKPVEKAEEAPVADEPAPTATPAGPAPDGLGDATDEAPVAKPPARRAPRKRTAAPKK
jgi:hypothetical protein